MTIRSRFFLWYSAITAVALIVLGFLAYSEFVVAPHEPGSDPPDFWSDAAMLLLWCAIPLALAGGWWVMQKTLAPIRALTDTVEKLHEHNLQDTLPRTGNGDEVDRLSEAFNEMITRLDDSFRRIRQFTLYASHELKTPLTIMRGEIETALHHPQLPAPVGECLQSQLGEIRRLGNIVDRLTLLTKADAGRVILAREALALDVLVREIVGDAEILASAHGLQVNLIACEPASMLGDRDTLRQLFLNLLDNAIKYNQPDGQIHIALRSLDRFAELKIANTGPGLAPELQAHVFDRFFRGDPAHGKAGSSSGLGLSIAQWIATAHGGTIRFESDKTLTTLTVRLAL